MKKFVSVISVLLVITSPLGAQEKTAVKKDFAFSADEAATIMVFRPDISVGEQSTAGLNEPNVAWTETAQKLLNDELVNSEITKKHNFVFLPEYDGENGKLLADYRALFNAVTSSVMTHQLFYGNRLPTKKNSDSLEYTMGAGTQKLAELGGGEYGLFFFTHDSYGSSGRKAMQAVGMLGCIIGACVIVNSGVHIGYAGLVDLTTGDLVWINADGSMGGDVREAEGAQKRVMQLLEDFPQAKYQGPIDKPRFITTEVQVGDEQPTVSSPIEQSKTTETQDIDGDSKNDSAGEAPLEDVGKAPELGNSKAEQTNDATTDQAEAAG